MRKPASTLFIPLVLAGIAACTANAPPAERTAMPQMPETPGQVRSGTLVSSLQVQPTRDSVRFVLQVTNAGTQPMALDFSSGQSFDFVVQQDGRELWRWSGDRMFTQALRSETLAAGETRTFSATWNPPAGLHGELVATGFLT
ncbi:MAG: hypothetical protein JO040_11215, partial [Gemmatimonadetes bacterium]|nr:hypothetical protein [Gemmatimonadota bacterium]